MSVFKTINKNLKRSLEARFAQVVFLNIDSEVVSAKAIIDEAEIVIFNGQTEIIEYQKVASIFTEGLSRKPRSGDVLSWSGTDYKLNKLLKEDFAEVRFSLVKVTLGAESRDSGFDKNVSAAKSSQLALFGEVVSLNIDSQQVSAKAIIDEAEIVIFNGQTEIIEYQKVASIFTEGLSRKPRSGDVLSWSGTDYKLNKLLKEDFAEVRFSLVNIGESIPFTVVRVNSVPVTHLGEYVTHA